MQPSQRTSGFETALTGFMRKLERLGAHLTFSQEAMLLAITMLQSAGGAYQVL
jgi:hypothetical protein